MHFYIPACYLNFHVLLVRILPIIPDFVTACFEKYNAHNLTFSSMPFTLPYIQKKMKNITVNEINLRISENYKKIKVHQIILWRCIII